MTTFDTPLEALAIEYASFGVLAIVNNVWTWIAVVTAAVSFWRMRVTNIDEGHACGSLEVLTDVNSEYKSGYLDAVEETVAPAKETVNETKVWEPLLCDDGVTNGKLTMYYEVDVDGEVFVDGDLTVVNNGECLGNCGDWWERWEKMVKLRNGDDGWYRYVDLKVINGNVVRLWDNDRICNNIIFSNLN